MQRTLLIMQIILVSKCKKKQNNTFIKILGEIEEMKGLKLAQGPGVKYHRIILLCKKKLYVKYLPHLVT